MSACRGRGRFHEEEKARDLERDGRYAMHSAVSDPGGSSGEFIVFGEAAGDADARALAVRSSSFEPEGRYVLFQLGVESASSTVHDGGRPVRRRWAAAPS